MWLARMVERLRRRSGGRSPAAVDAVRELHEVEALLDAGDRAGALGRFLDAFEHRPDLAEPWPEELDSTAAASGGELLLRWRLASLRALVHASDGEADAEADSSDGEEIRERYSELLEDYAGEEAARARIRDLGREIAAREDGEHLPHTLVRRGRWRDGGTSK